MEAEDVAAQVLPVQVGVHLGGGDAGVPQHFLYRPQVRTSLHQVGGEAVPEGVRSDGLSDPRERGQFADPLEHPHTGETVPTPVQEQDVLRLALNGQVGPFALPVKADLFHGLGAHRHQAFLVALSRHPDEALLEMQPADPKSGELAHPEAASIKRFQHGPIAVGHGPAHVDGTDQRIHFGHRQEGGQVPAQFRALEQFGGVVADAPVQTQAAVEGPDRTDQPCLTAGGKTLFGRMDHEALQVLQPHAFGVQGGGEGLRVGEQLVQVTQVGLHRPGAQGTLQLQVHGEHAPCFGPVHDTKVSFRYFAPPWRAS